MRKCLPALFLFSGLLLFSTFSAQAAPTVGAGVMVGEPSGGTVKLWIDRDEAWVFGLGVSPANDPSVQGQVDYILHVYEIGQAIGLTKTPLYTGLGFRVNGPEDDEVEAGIRIPIGLSHFFDRESVEVFAELAPVLDLVPELKGDVNFCVGIRFYQ